MSPHFLVIIVPVLWDGRSEDRMPLGGEIFRTRPDRRWGQQSLLHNGCWVILGDKAAGAWRQPPTAI